MTRPVMLVVMRLHDMHRVHPLMDSSHACSLCHKPVGIYPSGQRVMKQNRNVVVICQKCGADYKGVATSAPGAEIEVFQSVPRQQ